MPDTSKPTAAAPDTTAQRLEAVPGADGYRTLRVAAGEAHGERCELLRGSTRPEADTASLGGLIHFTDFQIADLASPARVEYLQRRDGDPEWQRMLPAYRPGEFLLPHAIEAMVRSIRAVGEARPGRFGAVLTTGDNTDSAQRNELSWFLGFLSGGRIDPTAGTRDFREAPVGQGDPEYWSPEPGDDRYKQRGFPTQPGAVCAAAAPYTGAGLGMPWLTCMGNHDCLLQGRADPPAATDGHLTGTVKPTAVGQAPAGEKLDAYIADPLWTFTGEGVTIAADPARAMYSTADYVRAHFDAPGEPRGHGFTPDNLRDGTAYYVWDGLPGLRLIVLDTTNRAGHVDGCVDEEQFAWLEARLQEVATEWHDPEGNRVTGSPAEARAVIIASHHGLSTMFNGFGDEPVRLAPQVRALLHRYPNVVLWLSGHTHINLVTPRPAPRTPAEAAQTRALGAPPKVPSRYDGRDDHFPSAHPDGAFWEVSTSSVCEWPVQFRLLEFAHTADAIAITSTIADSAVPPAPDGSNTLTDLAALHREVAANDTMSVGGLDAEGTPGDRNQRLWAPIPASLSRALGRTR